MIPVLENGRTTGYSFIAFYDDGAVAMRFGFVFDVFVPWQTSHTAEYSFNRKRYWYDHGRTMQERALGVPNQQPEPEPHNPFLDHYL